MLASSPAYDPHFGVYIDLRSIERNIRVRGGRFEYVWKRTRLKWEKCVVLFFPLFGIFF